MQSTNGAYGVTPLGDLATIIVTYTTAFPRYSSNALGGWFEMVGGRQRARHLLSRWMNRANETLGADYGEMPPPDLKFKFQPGACSVVPDTAANDGNSNTLSALTAAELVKRIVLPRELPAAQVFPNTTWRDSQTLLYGAAPSIMFPKSKWGGMSANSLDMIREGIDMAAMNRRSRGMYRTFSKDGWGYSSIRDAGEFLYNGYACYPDYSANNTVGGVEYVVSARVSVPLDTGVVVATARMREAMAALNAAILTGRLL